jgi:hypothetical protein
MEDSADETHDASRVQDKTSSTVAASRTNRSRRQENQRDCLEFRALRQSLARWNGAVIEGVSSLKGCVWSDSLIARARDIFP